MICTLSLPSVSTMTNDFESQIQKEVFATLRRTGYVELPHLEIHVVGDAVHLKGRVPSYYLKQKAHFAVLSVTGVARIIDEIDVVA